MVPLPLKALGYTLGVLAFAASACRHGEKTTGDRRAGGSSAVVARVDGAVITVSDLEKRINKQPPFVRARYTSAAKKRELVDELVQFEALAAEAARRGYDEDPEVRRTAKEQMVTRLVQKDFLSKIKAEDVPDADVAKYYDDHGAEFHQKDAVGVIAIFVKTKPKADLVYAEAQGLPKGPASLEEQQERFRELVTKYSDDRESKSRAGDLLFFYADSTVVPRPIIAAAFKLETVGDLALVKTDDGWAIILLKQKRRGFDRSLPEVKRQVQERLVGDLRTKAVDALVADLRKKSSITINDANLSKVVVEAGTSHPRGFTLPGELGAPIKSPPATSAH